MVTATPFPAPAKLNLFLHVVGRRADGYHLLQSVFALIELQDRLEIAVRNDGAIRRLRGNDGIRPEDDLMVRAAFLLQRESGCTLGADLSIDKRIPLGGGLGGGSSDAATVLLALNALWNLDWPVSRLTKLGLALGADVPFFVQGCNAWVEGIGETLVPVELPPWWYVVLEPPVPVSTAGIFASPELTRNSIPLKIADFSANGLGSCRNDL
ncbi:MAG TPA: 4-(cytidine 5'-diphospho)-2-C-methyl-D-erythritol kinase, partial [Usitatibacteraceae bacterium]|nr:4-(cytidine 5'-diphospho)-2-C-methyl-D-erythritol kinase [Usitatibacteraceae bacterium]